jgi:hypothetical protein
MKQVATPTQLTAAQELGRITLPGVLIAVETDQTSEQKHTQCNVRVEAKNEMIKVAHTETPGVWLAAFFTK